MITLHFLFLIPFNWARQHFFTYSPEILDKLVILICRLLLKDSPFGLMAIQEKYSVLVLYVKSSIEEKRKKEGTLEAKVGYVTVFVPCFSPRAYAFWVRHNNTCPFSSIVKVVDLDRFRFYGLHTLWRKELGIGKHHVLATHKRSRWKVWNFSAEG